MKQKSKNIDCELIIAKSCGRLIGIEVNKILGVTDKSDIFQIPQLKPPLLGLGKYLNKVLAVVDTGLFCGLRRTEKHQITKWIISETKNGLSAFAVDDVIGIKLVNLKGKTSKKKIVSDNFELEGKSGDRFPPSSTADCRSKGGYTISRICCQIFYIVLVLC